MQILTYRDIKLIFQNRDIKSLFLYMSACIFILFGQLGEIRKMQMEVSPQIRNNWRVFTSWQSQFSLSSVQGRCVEIPPLFSGLLRL